MKIFGSATGRKHYLDSELDLFEPVRSAEAVRKLLDDAEAQVLAGQTLLR